jgi:rRNA biogenesis protein RRP5
VTDDESGSWKEHVREGQAVKAVVLDVNLETKKVSLGLKKSLFPEGAVDDSDEEMDGENDDEEDEDDLEAILAGAAAGGDDSEEDSEEDVEMQTEVR